MEDDERFEAPFSGNAKADLESLRPLLIDRQKRLFYAGRRSQANLCVAVLLSISKAEETIAKEELGGSSEKALRIRDNLYRTAHFDLIFKRYGDEPEVDDRWSRPVNAAEQRRLQKRGKDADASALLGGGRYRYHPVGRDRTEACTEKCCAFVDPEPAKEQEKKAEKAEEEAKKEADKAAAQKAAEQAAHVPVEQVTANDGTYLEAGLTAQLCPFCAESNLDFVEFDLMDAHFDRTCPTLTACQLCNKSVFIPKLTEHWGRDCNVAAKEGSSATRECDKCFVRLPKDRLSQHQSGDKCKAVVCPMCEAVLGDSTEGTWRDHLIGTEACAENPRRHLSGIPAQAEPSITAPSALPTK